MEEHLIQEESNPRTAKRGRFECASLSQDVPLWYELARYVPQWYELAKAV